MYLNRSEYENYKAYLRDKSNGKILTPDGLKTICNSCNNDPKEIGKYMLKILAEIGENNGNHKS